MSDRPRALITGSGKRIGSALAERCAKLGFDVYLHVLRSYEYAEALLETLPDAERHTIVKCDLSNPEARKAWLESMPGFDLVVNNASCYRLTAPGQEETPAIRERYWQVNYYAPMDIMMHQIKHLEQKSDRQGRGLLINMLDSDILDSCGGVYPQEELPPGEDSYLATKVMLGNMTKTMALEYASILRVNGIAPGAVLPPVDCPTAGMKRILERVPLHQPTEVEELAAALELFWRSPSMTGVILPLDGGMHLNNEMKI